MGAWGSKPYENDTAADWFGRVIGKSELSGLIAQGLRSSDYDEQRAAAWLLSRIGVP